MRSPMVLSYGGRAPALPVKICTRRPELTQQMQGWLKQRKGGATGVARQDFALRIIFFYNMASDQREIMCLQMLKMSSR